MHARCSWRPRERARNGIVKLTQKLARLCSKEKTVEGFGRSRAPVFSLFPPPRPSSRERRLGAKFHYRDNALQGSHASTALWHPDGHGVESGQERPPSCTGDCPDAVVCGRWHAYNRLAGPAAVTGCLGQERPAGQAVRGSTAPSPPSAAARCRAAATAPACPTTPCTTPWYRRCSRTTRG
jgi:hypothetical protein